MKTKTNKKTNKPKYTSAAIRKKLAQSRTALVTFHKIDGSKRVMYCTLQTYMMPANMLPSKPSKPSKTAIAVYDLDKCGWRSFRVASVISVK